MSAPTVRPRWARRVGAVWLAAGMALLLAGIVVVVDQHRPAWELAAGLVCLSVGWFWWQRQLTVDEHGIEQRVGWRHTRLLWGVVDRVVLPSSSRPTVPIVVWLAGRGEVVLRASWGLSRSQHQQLAAAFDVAAATAGVVLETAEEAEAEGAEGQGDAAGRDG